jgi:Leucine-rich repeat (LRR) protein
MSITRHTVITSIDQIMEEPEKYKEANIIELGTKQLTYIPEIITFVYIRHLYCDDNDLYELPMLPPNLIILNCTNNKLTSLPRLPDSLEILHCSNNKIRYLPKLPSHLVTLVCNYNDIYEIPNLPDTIKTIMCCFNRIGFLPFLPESLVSLYCSGNAILFLPRLPTNLKYLVANSNDITEFTKHLPPQLECLNICNNHIRELPVQLPTSLKILHCVNNNLSRLPMLHEGLNVTCSENNLHLYYPTLIEDNNRCVKIEPINVINRFRNSYYYNKWKWAFLEIYAKRKMHPSKISKLLENQNINELDNNQIELIFA